MTPKEELAELNKEVEREVREFDAMCRALKYKKQRMLKLYADQDTLWKKIINSKHK